MTKTLKVCPAQGYRATGTFKDYRYDVRVPYTELEYNKAIDLIAVGLVSLVRFIDGKPIEQISADELKKELSKRDRIEPAPIFNPVSVSVPSTNPEIQELRKTVEAQQATIAEAQRALAENQAMIAKLLQEREHASTEPVVAPDPEEEKSEKDKKTGK